MKKHAGFTLLELLVAVGLMVILMTAIVMIFHNSTGVMKVNGARIDIYENARTAVDRVATDWENQISVSTGRQRAELRDFVRLATPTAPAGSDADGAADYIGFVTVATVPNGASRELKLVYVEYFLTTDDDAETSMSGAGSNTAIRSGRPIFALKRRVWALPLTSAALQAAQTAGVPITDKMPGPLTTTSTKAPGTYAGLTLIEDADLCHWVVSFNVEALEYDPAKAPGPSNPAYQELSKTALYVPGVMPLGDVPGSEPVIPRKIRVSLRIIEGAPERQERLIQREMWTPMGG